MSEQSGARYEFDGFSLDPISRRLSRVGVTIPLNMKQFEILLLLVERAGQLVTKEDFMKVVWEGRFVEDNNLTVTMSGLRRALGDSSRGRRYIETVPKHGYRFVSRVRVINDDVDAAGGAGGAPAQRPRRDTDSLAVLPFLNPDGDESLEYFVEGLTESLINSLSGVGHLRVLARSTVFRLKGVGRPPEQVGAELGVGTVLAGWARRVAGRLLIGVELVGVRDGARIWGASYNRPPSEVYLLHEEIIREITDGLRVGLTNVEWRQLTRSFPISQEVFEYYLKGLYFWNKRTEEGIRKGIAWFERAISRDPGFAPAYAGLSGCYSSIFTNIGPSGAALKLAVEAATKALEIDDRLAEAYASLGFAHMLSWDWAEAGAALGKAVRSNPNSALSHYWYAIYLSFVGRLEEALSEARKAFQLDPLSSRFCHWVARILLFARRYDEAIETCREAVELEESYYSALGLLGWIYAEKGEYDEAMECLKKGLTITNDPDMKSVVGYTYGLFGRAAEAREVLADLLSEREGRYVPPSSIAAVYAGLKDADRAFEWLERAYEEREFALSSLAISPVFDCLRDDPRYAELERRVGLAQYFGRR